ncbi:quinoprotein dehydrogenase-associated probable ABC transporter substrate-binding protein [Variovorax paradoxus]|uniref:Quinoprotein dehydrogenase-associated probable ABC transporter substrate-binding protein n=1 Tax=Variovorax paradoxus TaxID=34073 RepID=A0AAE3Y2S8_VARPD|nr:MULTISPECIES: substrate-binding domain-containing protein [Variovorax]MBD9664050.1 quinoprotein dehydrogenase-associated putative ABC transporter substrate-binding protein [Variovorax sp. VRV01]MDP9964927.1 quinoprotein dehydrogenase-associated probable ABC transporter substrate-binding protein [Variovorax paradoxus]MDR6428572.1 quinoprotein dehydrogenase-associated probable ABC transporter substrate-binding protein [Variovorax paradoxus]
MTTRQPAAKPLSIGARLRAGLLGAACCCALVPALAQETPPRKALRVCQDPNNMPFSNTKAEGIENRIAELFGKALGLPVTYYSFPQRLAFFRNTLRFKLPGQDYPCDIVMGVPVGLDEVSVTKPYYRSTYALVFPKGKGMDNVASAEDFLKLDPAKLKSLRIGIYDRSPASQWLNKHGLLEQGVPYKLMSADPAQYPGEIVEKDLAEGKLDAVVVWGPIAGYFARRVKNPALVVVPLKSEKGVRLDYQMAMGVRYGEREWKQQVEGLIESKAPEIQAILKEFGVPLVDASFGVPTN